MSIVLDLSKHCVETEIKRVHRAAVSAYFRGGADRAQLEQTIELTRQALESLDFGSLRSRCTPLAGRSEAHVVLTLDGTHPVIRVSGHAVPTQKDPREFVRRPPGHFENGLTDSPAGEVRQSLEKFAEEE
jgi:hypothetical protein